MDWIPEIINERTSACEKFHTFASPHEGFAVIKEELDELWSEIKANGYKKAMANEAVQVAAMALRFLEDCCE